MSQKWQRSKAWDDRNIPPGLWPLKALLRAFSSIPLAVVLLSCVVIFAILASVPIGLLARIPTAMLWGVSLIAVLGLVAALPLWALSRALSGWKDRRRGARFVILFAVGLVLSAAGAWAWWQGVWPRLRYDPGTGSGVLLFADFVERYKATTLRRLPGLEMSELEFYSWWPLRVVLGLFIANMIVATARRIEFIFKNIGVLTVHSGIITIAFGSMYYSALKLEGDTVLLAGAPGADGEPVPGPPQDRFYDNTRVALYVNGGLGWEQRPLTDVPRYNDYGLNAGGTSKSVSELIGRPASEGLDPLNLPVVTSAAGLVDPALKFRVVGYAGYATPSEDWVEEIPRAANHANPLRMLYLHSGLPDRHGKVSDNPVFSFTMLPKVPARRVADNGEIGFEYAIGASAGMSPQRWADLSEPLPPGNVAGLVVEVPAGNFRAVYPAKTGEEIVVGETGYRLTLKELMARPPFPIITPGYQGAQSSVAVVTVASAGGEPYDRWVYHRFPEISQDFLEEKAATGMPKRRSADPAIRISYIDAAPLLQVYLDEGDGGLVRAIVRRRGGDVRVIDKVEHNRLQLVEILGLSIGERWASARRIERPEPVPERQRDKSMIGTHDQAMLGVEVSAAVDGKPWNTVVWLPFTKYMGVGLQTERQVDLPNGGSVQLAFGRQAHRLAGFAVRLLDFEMIAYDHRGAPRDYQSKVRVTPLTDPILTRVGTAAPPAFEAFDHVAKLNEPLTAPFQWSDDRPWVANFFGRLVSGLSPHQFKFSQAGWDQTGWSKSQEDVDRGLAKRPRASFTILGVGNNPGIHLVALGGVLMGFGIPWAFYLKPWLVQREKRKIQEQLKAGTYRKPGTREPDVPAGSLEPVGVQQ